MITVSFPNNNIPEREYAIRVLFSEILGCPLHALHLSAGESERHYRIQGFGKTVLIEDHFFGKYHEPLSYMKMSSIPSELSYFHLDGESVPILYGRDYYAVSSGKMVVGLDIFASVFFMLSRWEESIYGREENGDCDETLLFCVKNGIHTRPIVHEYASLLSHLLGDPESLRPSRNYSVVLTHDVDALLTPTWVQIMRSLVKYRSVGGLVHNKSISLGDVLRYKFRFPTIYSQTEDFIRLAKHHGIAEWFYIKVCAPGERGCTYNYRSEAVRQYISWLCKETGLGNVGFHPSQLTFDNQEMWERETSRIREFLQGNPRIGRNHHLLYNSNTLRNWAGFSANADDPVSVSNCVFHKRLGFRSGTVVPYTVFDVFERETLPVKECPCAIMDTALSCDGLHHFDSLKKEIREIVDSVKQFDGQVLLTWHILIREVKKYDFLFRLCQDTIAYAKGL